MLWLFLLACMHAFAGESTLPVLVYEASAIYPEEALADGLEGSVVLEITVSAGGAVTKSRVVESTASVFEAPARQASWSLQFEPARDAEGRPVPSIIQYRYLFEAAAVPVVSLRGVMYEAGVKRVLADTVVRLVGPQQQEISTRTDANGEYELADLQPGVWNVAVEKSGFRSELFEAEIVDGKVVELDIYLLMTRPWEEESFDELVVVEGRRRAPQITERVLDADAIRYLPGTNGDVVRVVQNLPGVARPPLNIGQLIIRGMAPEESSYALDGGRLPLVFHFAGFSTVISGDVLSEVAFLPGGYGVRYGRTLGGVVDLRTESEITEKSRGIAEVDLFQASLFVEQPIGENGALTVSGRRSYADAILNPILSKSGGTFRAPRYYDGLIRYAHKTPVGLVDALVLVSDDGFRFLGADSEEGEVQLSYTTAFQKGRIRAELDAGRGWRVETSLTGGPEVRSFGIAPSGEAEETTWAASLRHEWYRPRGDSLLGARIGLDTALNTFSFLYDVPAFGVREEGSITGILPGGYGELSLGVGGFEVIGGVRADGVVDDNDYSAFVVDPRLAFRQALGPQFRLKGNVGRFSQFPLPREVEPPPSGSGNQNLVAERALQTSFGLEAALGARWDTEVTGFYHGLSDLVVGREDAFRFFTGPPPSGPLDTRPYANAGVGRTYGVETLIRYTDERTLAWVAATWSRSLRRKRPKDDVALFRYDQPLVLTAIGSRELGKRWRFGARVRYGSGNPYTEVVNRSYDLTERTFQPVYGASGESRLPAFFALDLRLDKDYVYRKWTLTTYIDIQNATNAQNLELMAWSYDYEVEEPITTPPTLPTFGFRGKW